VILIVAAAADAAATTLAQTWHRADARCLRPADLSMPGWRHFVGAKETCGAVVVGGSVEPESAVTGVLTRTSWISPYELPVIAEAYRSYAATEMSAFLLSWLSSLNCPVVNRPTPGCLAGPPWRTSQWMAAAAMAGLKVPDLRQMREPHSNTVQLTVVGTRCFGTAAPELHAATLRLAALATTELLGVVFEGDQADAIFLGATAFPSLDSEEIQEALLGVLSGHARRPVSVPDLRPWRPLQPGRSSSLATASPICCPVASSK
jgi:hypothetical protein